MEFPELDSLFRDLLASNHGPGYGIAASDAAPDLSHITVELRFLAGRTYCCAEPGCHLPRGVGRLVRLASERGIHVPAEVVVRWHCRVEPGVLLENLSKLGLPPTETGGYEFEAVSRGLVEGRVTEGA